MRTFKQVIISLLVVLLILAGCSNNNTPGTSDIATEITEPVEITFWHAMNAAQEEALTKIVNDFMAENDKITVVLQNQGSYRDMQSKLIASYQNPSDLPNMTQAYPGAVYPAFQDDLLVSLEDYINNDVIGMDDYNDIVEGFREAGKIEKTIYGLPFTKSTEAVFYNKTVLDSLGLKAPRTLEELVEVSKVVAEKTNMVGAGWDSLNNYYSTFMYNEGVAFDETLDPTSAASQKALEFYLDGIRDGYFRIAGSDGYLSGPFENQLLAISIGSTAGESYIRGGAARGGFEAGAVPMPFDTQIQQGPDVWMFDNGATAEEKTATFLFMKYLVSAEATLYWAEKTGYFPVRTSVLESSEYKNLQTLVAPIAAEMLKKTFTLPLSANSNDAYNELASQMEVILSQPGGNLNQMLQDMKVALDDVWSQ